jgi:single-strand DNA-binding protein
MSAYLNKCEFIGNVGKDAEVRTTPGGSTLAKFSIAVNRKYKDKLSGEEKEQVEWINLVMWGKRAEAVARWITKGKQLYVEGEMQTRTYDDDKGVRRYFTEINVRDLQFLGPKPTTAAGEPTGDYLEPGADDDSVPY